MIMATLSARVDTQTLRSPVAVAYKRVDCTKQTFPILECRLSDVPTLPQGNYIDPPEINLT